MKANSINRTALTVIPKQPYIDWANSLDDGPKLDINNPYYEPTVYLIDEVDDVSLRRVLKRYYPLIFENELAGWHLVVDDWPQKRDARTFKKWFEMTVSTVVLDLSQRHIELEDYEI